MLGSIPSGDAYTERQLEEMGRAAGFACAIRTGGQRVRSKVGSESDLSWAAIPTKVGTRPG